MYKCYRYSWKFMEILDIKNEYSKSTLILHTDFLYFNVIYLPNRKLREFHCLFLYFNCDE